MGNGNPLYKTQINVSSTVWKLWYIEMNIVLSLVKNFYFQFLTTVEDMAKIQIQKCLISKALQLLDMVQDQNSSFFQIRGNGWKGGAWGN